MRESNTKYSLSHIKISQNWSTLILPPLSSFIPFTSLYSVFYITFSRLFLTSRLKIANRSFYHSAPVLWNNLPSYLPQVVHHVTPPISKSPVYEFSTSLFLNKGKPHLFTLYFLLIVTLYSPKLSRSGLISIRYSPSFVFSSHTHFAIIHANLYVIWLVSMNKWS